MEGQQAERVGGVGARTPGVQAAMAAARRVMQDQRSEAQVALDAAVARMLAEIAEPEERARAQPGAVEETAPAVHAAGRCPAPAGPGLE